MVNFKDKWISLIDGKEFQKLFLEELGWDRPQKTEELNFEYLGENFAIHPVAGFKGIQVWSCEGVPNARIQREIDRIVSKVSAERLIIFYNNDKQSWRWPMSKESTGKGVVRLINHEHIVGQVTLSLLQRLQMVAISLDAPEPSLVEMLLRLRKAFDADQITKSFYREFSARQKGLLEELGGIELKGDKEWYSSLLLNRLMFIYFMQWKGFMDGDLNYLANRLKAVQALQGKNKFYNFFRDFLLPLFHSGLGVGKDPNSPEEILKLIGKIPYINGGIFSEHELELRNDIQIPDEAFEAIFTFFDKYQWHLDSRRTGNQNEINPDVLGYVFEQFVNNKEKGAYYTKEDVTEYMSSTTLTTTFLEKLQNQCKVNIFKPLVENPERYIWQSLTFGEDARELHTELQQSTKVDNNLDQKSDQHVGLPGETWWETRERLEYLDTLRDQISHGSLKSVNDLVSANVDIDLLAADVVDALDSSDDVLKAWNILSDLKVVDPTCGSGAFLFAALNHLQQIYSAVLDAAELHQLTQPEPGLSALLSRVHGHPNREYFILKHAAQQNIYGVDLMKEAAEIARLRLFLKLISAIDNFQDIEPLPDLEFNIKSGNLLIGVSNKTELEKFAQTFDFQTFLDDTATQVGHLAELWEHFKSAQESGPEKAASAKKMLSSGIQILRTTLDKLIFDQEDKKSQSAGFEAWRAVASPFHWFIEFPAVFEKDGFDVVIGNPPYIRKSKVDYSLKGHETLSSPDIYAMCMERAAKITAPNGRFSMIVMTNLVFSSEYVSLRKYLRNRFETRWVSGFAKRPSVLFEGVQVRNTIFIGSRGEVALYSAPLKRWTKDFRPHLMSSIRYAKVLPNDDETLIWPFITSDQIYLKIKSLKGLVGMTALKKGPEYSLSDGVPSWDTNSGSMHPLFFMGTAYNWISTMRVVPPVIDGDGNSTTTSKLNVIWFKNEKIRDLAFTLFSSKWMFAWWAIVGDDFDVTKDNLLSFPYDLEAVPEELAKKLDKAADDLNKSMISKLKWQTVTFPGGRQVKVGNWDYSNFRSQIDPIDALWAEVFGASNLLNELKFQYFSTVKTEGDSSELEDSQE